ncbi:MAG: SPOR domain-containing protein [Campylobacterales bacterium]
MEDKQELKDILIDENENKTAASKKILLFSAAGLLVFIFAIFIVYALSGDGDESEEQSSAVPTEEVVTEESVTTEEVMPEPMSEDTNFQQVPIENAPESENEDRFDKMIQDIKDKNLPAPPKEPETTAPKEPEREPEKPQTSQEKSPKQDSSSSTDVPKGYYLQVGANVKHDPDKKFLQKISDSDFSYKLQRLDRDGKEIIRTLIGPYSSRSAAKADLEKAKKSINQNAFVYEVK